MTALLPRVTCHLLPTVFAANLGLKPRAAALGEQPAYQGPVHCIATIVRTEGLAGLYRGASAMLLRDVPGYCLYFIPYVLLNDWITPEASAGPSPCAVWLAGGMAGKAAALIPVLVLAMAVGQLGSLPCPPQPQGRARFTQELFAKYLLCQAEEGLGLGNSPPSFSHPLPSGPLGMASPYFDPFNFQSENIF